jgi:YebC/PmpR family DNA-binding regulatory protein
MDLVKTKCVNRFQFSQEGGSMGRHATVAGRQAASAAARSKSFTRVGREVTVAAKLGGGDPGCNPRLRLAMDHAREVNMPKDTVERLVKKAIGELGGVSYEEITYEAYGPGGSAIMIEVMTDNRNRTNPELKRVFQKNGGNQAEIGTVSWMFKRQGVIDVSLVGTTEDKVMEVALEAGAEDVEASGGISTVYTETADFQTVRDAIEKAAFKIERSGLEFVSSNEVDVSGGAAKTLVNLLNALEDHDDVQNVFHNANIPEEAFS